MPPRRWIVREPKAGLESRLRETLGLSPIAARLLVHRGLEDPEQARAFRQASLEDLHNPFAMTDMEKAVERIVVALEREEQIVVYGDYDVDGVASTALLCTFFSEIGSPVRFYLPHRIEDGYGLNSRTLERLKEQGAGLVITVDNGVSAVEPAETARRLGLDLIITDHHEPPEVLPRALALIDPRRPGCPYPFKSLSGVGVAFKLIVALRHRLRRSCSSRFALPNLKRHLDLVALGTVADVAPVGGENHHLLRHGLHELGATTKPGLQALKEAAGLKGEVTASDIGFRLAPRLNAVGRLGAASAAVRLLLAAQREEADSLAALLEAENRRRQQAQEQIYREAKEQLAREENSSAAAIVLASSRWHPGIIGIVASKLAETTLRPVVLIALANGQGRGSARGIPGLDLYGCLRRCASELEQFGGHRAAAGFTLETKNVERFRDRFQEAVAACGAALDLPPPLEIDGEADFNEIDAGAVSELEALSPFGTGYPPPVFLFRSLSCVGRPQRVGRGGDHLKFRLGDGRRVVEVIAFSCPEETAATVREAHFLDLAATPQLNSWQGCVGVQLRACDLRSGGAPGARPSSPGAAGV